MVVRRTFGAAACVALALLASACGGSASDGSGPGVAPPTASPTGSTSPSTAAVDPELAAILAAGKTHAIRDSDVTVTLPRGWTALPLDPKQFVAALTTFMRSSSAAQAALKGQDLEQMAKTFAFFGVKTSSGGATNINVIDIGDTTGVSTKEAISEVKQTLKGIGADVDTAGTKTLPIDEVVYATYTLSAGGQQIDGVQYYLLGRRHSLTITLSTPDLVVNQKSFDAIAQGLQRTS